MTEVMNTGVAKGGYRFAVAWIALNDEPDIRAVGEVSGFISVMLIADLYGKSIDQVAKAVVAYRKKWNV